jgi:hypothetical protein
MFGRAKVLLTIASLALATPVAAQAPATTTTAFDRKYVGTAALTKGHMRCSPITSVDMTIAGEQVVIHEIELNVGRPTYWGSSVNAAGEVSASHQSRVGFFTVSGTIHDKVFTGQHVHGTAAIPCYYSRPNAKGTRVDDSV